ncbi:unnamed protein product [Ixodes pacificus]
MTLVDADGATPNRKDKKKKKKLLLSKFCRRRISCAFPQHHKRRQSLIVGMQTNGGKGRTVFIKMAERGFTELKEPFVKLP